MFVITKARDGNLRVHQNASDVGVDDDGSLVYNVGSVIFRMTPKAIGGMGDLVVIDDDGHVWRLMIDGEGREDAWARLPARSAA